MSTVKLCTRKNSADLLHYLQQKSAQMWRYRT